jgi:hypothetical protein
MTCDVDPACDCQEKQKDEYHDCPECGITLDAELFPTLRACYDHEEDRETLREIAAELDDLNGRQRKRCKSLEDQIKTLEAQLRGMP